MREIVMVDMLRTFSNGREVEVPATLPGIREALPEERRADFDAAVAKADVHTIHAVMRHWILELVEDDEERAVVSRLRSREGRAA
ncbi:hypothetical protein [Streptomyces sp. NPDC001205]